MFSNYLSGMLSFSGYTSSEAGGACVWTIRANVERGRVGVTLGGVQVRNISRAHFNFLHKMS